MIPSNSYYELKELDFDEVLHKSWGKMSFLDLYDQVVAIHKMLMTMGMIISTNNSLPSDLIEEANYYFDEFQLKMRFLQNWEYNASELSNFSNIKSTKELYRSTFKSMLTGIRGNEQKTENFLTIYNTVISYQAPDSNKVNSLEDQLLILTSEISSLKSPVETKLLDLQNAKDRFDSLNATLEQSAKEKTVEDYAAVFKKEASQNKDAASIWMAISVVACIAFCLFVRFEDSILPITQTNNSVLLTLEYVKRLLIISFLIFIITFLLKQFAVKKHLQTLNTHRQNTLDSYNLFIQSMGSAEQDVKNSLMMEVARAIYESGQTGYINTKDEVPGSNSITEITKFIRPN